MGVGVVQRSVIAVLVVPAILLFAMTLGRRFVVDWDSLIGRYQRWEQSLVRQAVPTRGQHQAYRKAVLERRAVVKAELAERVARRDELRERYHHDNAAAFYLREQQALERRRARLLEQASGGGLQALRSRWHERTLREFLRQQGLRTGGVPGVGAREVALAVAQGIRTALEVDTERVRALPAPLGRELLAWRRGLEDFFQFDPSVIPRGEINDLRRHGGQQLAAEVQDFERQVREFGRTRWDQHETDISRQLGTLQAEIDQHRRALKKLRSLDT